MSRPPKHLLFSLMKHIHSREGSACSCAVLLSTGARCSSLMHSVCPRSSQRKVRLRKRSLEVACEPFVAIATRRLDVHS